MGAVQIGPMSPNWTLLSLFIAAAAGYGALALRLRLSALEREPCLTLFFNGFVIGVAGWKIAPLLAEPSLLWKAPLKIVLMPGGATGVAVGALAALVYVFLRALHAGVTLMLLADLAAYGGAAFLTVRAFITGPRYGTLTGLPWGIVLGDPAKAYHPLHLYAGVVAAAIFAWLWVRYRDTGDGRAAVFTCVSGGIAFFALTFLEAETAAASGFLLTPAQWMSAIAVLLGLLLPRLDKLWTDLLERRSTSMNRIMSEAQREQRRENERAARQEVCVPKIAAGDKKKDGPNRPAE